MDFAKEFQNSLEKILDTFGCPKPHRDDLIRVYDHTDCPCNITRIGGGNYYFIAWVDDGKHQMTVLKRMSKHEFFFYDHYTLYCRSFGAGEYRCHSFHIFDNNKYDSELYDEKNGGL